jgi:3-oxoacyl-[acyl-carrier protein] reductase
MPNVLVTGGSRGLGLGIACKLAAAGHCVIALARKPSEALTSAIASADAAKAGSLHFVPFDLGDLEAIPKLVRSLRKDFGPIHCLVNNAGISFEGALAMLPTSQIEQLVRINTVSPIVLTKYVVRSMMADGGGRIVNLSSVTAFTGFTGLSVYSATKASLLGFSRSLAREAGRMGITVNCVAPGFVETDMTRGLSEEEREKVVRRSALRRLAGVDDVADAVEFLLSERAKNITGTVLTVDAGGTA